MNLLLNDMGQVAFAAALIGSGGEKEDAILLGDGITLAPIAREGQSAPDGDGTFFQFLWKVAAIGSD